MAANIVQTVGLTKRYGDRVALDHVDITVRAGEVYGVLGANGAGKTTLLRILLGLVRPSEGTATVHGAPAGSHQALDSVGMLIEEPAAYPYLSGRDNLRVFARYAGVGSERIDEVLEIVELHRRARDRVATYSLGMRQRLGIAVALLKDPELLVLDEPTNGLDPAGVADVRTLLRRLSSAGQTVVVSSHLLSEVEQVCSRIGVLSEGRMLREGTVADLIGRRPLRIDAEPLEQAHEIVARRVGEQNVESGPHGLIIDAELDAAAGLNRELVMAGVRVQALGWEDRSLEQVFLGLTATGATPADREDVL